MLCGIALQLRCTGLYQKKKLHYQLLIIIFLLQKLDVKADVPNFNNVLSQEYKMSNYRKEC